MTAFDRAARVVADLDSPFYAEERQRDVWNEASAVGFQTLLWGGLGLACAMAWFGGTDVRPWTLALLLVTGAGSFAAMAYAHRRGVTGTENVRLLGPRMFLAAALGIGGLAGLAVRADGGVSPATIVGGAVGAALALGGFLLARRRIRNQD